MADPAFSTWQDKGEYLTYGQPNGLFWRSTSLESYIYTAYNQITTMTPEQDILRELHGNEIDEVELASICLSEFGGASRTPTEAFFGGLPEYSLNFVYKNNRLSKILRGPGLSADKLAKLQAVVESELKATATSVGGQVLFASVPVKGCLRYREQFQIIPVPTEAPQPPDWGPGPAYPFIVQFKYKPSTYQGLDSLRHLAQERLIHLILAGLLRPRIHKLGPSVRFHWGIPNAQPNDPSLGKSEYRQELYQFPDLTRLMHCAEFTPIVDRSVLPRVESVEYYTRVGTVLKDPELEIPSNLEMLIDQFYSLPGDEQDRFLRACFWLNHAHTVYSDSFSSAFTALISSLEALMETDTPIGTCPACKRSMGKGSTRRLREFLDQYAPSDPKFEAPRAQLYWEFRSKLLHGGELSLADRKQISGMSAQGMSEWQLFHEVWELVKVVLVNWLHSRNRLLIARYRPHYRRQRLDNPPIR